MGAGRAGRSRCSADSPAMSTGTWLERSAEHRADRYSYTRSVAFCPVAKSTPSSSRGIGGRSYWLERSRSSSRSNFGISRDRSGGGGMCLRPGSGGFGRETSRPGEGVCLPGGDGGAGAVGTTLLPGLRDGSGVVGRAASRPGAGVLPDTVRSGAGDTGVLASGGRSTVGAVGTRSCPGAEFPAARGGGACSRPGGVVRSSGLTAVSRLTSGSFPRPGR